MVYSWLPENASIPLRCSSDFRRILRPFSGISGKCDRRYNTPTLLQETRILKRRNVTLAFPVIKLSIERVMLRVTHLTQVEQRIRSSTLHRLLRINDKYWKEEQLAIGFNVMSSTGQEDRRPDDQTSSRS